MDRSDRAARPSDPVRDTLRVLLRRNGFTMKSASLAIGRNQAYLHQYLERGMPRVLRPRDSEALAKLLHCNPEAIRHRAARPGEPEQPASTAPPPGVRVVAVVELAGEAGAGLTALDDDFPPETQRWYFPETVVRHEARANPNDLRIVIVHGNSMEPDLRDGDRVVADTARRVPETGQLCVFWDGNGLLVRRPEYVPGSSPPQLRLIAANLAYAPYTCLAHDAQVVGTVLWTIQPV